MTCRKFLTFVDRHTKKFGSGFQLSKKAFKTAYIALKKKGGGKTVGRLSTYSLIFFHLIWTMTNKSNIRSSHPLYTIKRIEVLKRMFGGFDTLTPLYINLFKHI